MMQTLILRSDSEENIRLLLQLAKKLEFSAYQLSQEKAEDLGIAISILDGMQSGVLDEDEKFDFISKLQSNES